MPIKPFRWRCPFCDHNALINDELFSAGSHKLPGTYNSEGRIGLQSHFIICPNRDCRKTTLNVWIRRWERVVRTGASPIEQFASDHLMKMRLLPLGDGRPLPDYVPKVIREDYEEACSIRDLSPKASATLSRRALQGILRDYYKVKPGNLASEIDALKDKMGKDLFDAVHAVRKVGNIGAHMEADINVIVEVEPNEAQLLIELVETLIEETYVHTHDRTERLNQVTALAKTKEAQRKGTGEVDAPDRSPFLIDPSEQV